MCWKTFIKENAAVLTAETDIPVFKVVLADEIGEKGKPYYAWCEEKFRFFQKRTPSVPPYQEEPVCVYEKGVTYRPSAFDVPYLLENGSRIACSGFHSFSSGCVAEMEPCPQDDLRIANRVAVYAPDGPRIDLLFELTYECLAVMKCVIPAGSHYCVNEHGEYVSDALRVESFEPPAPKAAAD